MPTVDDWKRRIRDAFVEAGFRVEGTGVDGIYHTRLVFAVSYLRVRLAVTAVMRDGFFVCDVMRLNESYTLPRECKSIPMTEAGVIDVVSFALAFLII